VFSTACREAHPRRALRKATGSLAFLLLLAMASYAGNAGAGCCQLTRVAEEAAANVEACEPDGSGGCGSVLWQASLAPGQSVEVCPSGDLVVYLDSDPTTGAFEPPTTATCDGSEVDL